MDKVFNLIGKSTTYYSPIDEAMYFEWIDRIPAIVDVKGIGDELHIFVSTDLLDEPQLVELIALFYRYKDDMKQFQQFLTDGNREWLADKHAYWHRRMFGINKEKKAKSKNVF